MSYADFMNMISATRCPEEEIQKALKMMNKLGPEDHLNRRLRL